MMGITVIFTHSSSATGSGSIGLVVPGKKAALVNKLKSKLN